jgi:hypothetical protein
VLLGSLGNQPNLTDQWAVDGPADSLALFNATTNSANWLIEIPSHTAANTFFIKLHPSF